MHPKAVTNLILNCRSTLAVLFCLGIISTGRLISGDNTEKIWAHRIFAKQKTDVPKARKMTTGRLGSVVSPPNLGQEAKPPRSFDFFSFTAR